MRLLYEFRFWNPSRRLAREIAIVSMDYERALAAAWGTLAQLTREATPRERWRLIRTTQQAFDFTDQVDQVEA